MGRNEGQIKRVLSSVSDADITAVDPEPELIRRAQSGDETAFGELVHLRYEPVFRHVVAMTRNEHDARDICQEIWVTVWRSLKDYRGESKFSTWLYSIASRRAIDHLRKRQRWFDRFLPFLTQSESGEVIEPASPELGPRDVADAAERKARFDQAIEALPPKQRDVLVLREIDGLSYEEIAQTLHCRTGTVMSRLFNARRLLAQKIKDLPCD